MKYAILSDLHANLDALERVLADAARFGVESVVCLGDIVGYGPLPAETLRRIRALASVVLAGNHDDAVSGRIDAGNFIDLAGDAVSRHREALSRDDLAWLKSLPHTAAIEGAVLSHGDLTSPAGFRYLDSEEAARENFAATESALVFVGHTHVPGLYLTGWSGRIYALDAEDFVVEDGKRYIVNVGSVGYPRESKGQCYSTYVIYDSAERSVRFHRLAFAVSSVLQRGRGRGRRGLLVGLTAILLATAGALVAGRLAYTDSPPLPKPVYVNPSLPKPVMERTLVLEPGTEKVKANLKLGRNSPSAVLSVSFVDADGNAHTPVVLPFKTASTQGFNVPSNAVKAVFSISPSDDGSLPVVKEFSPVAE